MSLSDDIFKWRWKGPSPHKQETNMPELNQPPSLILPTLPDAVSFEDLDGWYHSNDEVRGIASNIKALADTMLAHQHEKYELLRSTNSSIIANLENQIGRLNRMLDQALALGRKE